MAAQDHATIHRQSKHLEHPWEVVLVWKILVDDAAIMKFMLCQDKARMGAGLLSSYARSAAPVIGLILQIGWSTVPSEAIGMKKDPDSISSPSLYRLPCYHF